jgi:hypothetical protein
MVPAAPKFFQLKGMILSHSQHHFRLFRILLYSVPLLQKALRSTGKYLQSTCDEHRFTFSLFGHFRELLEGSVSLFRKLSCSVMTSQPFDIVLMKRRV